MQIRVLGSSAGGGLPQWNCGGTYSVRARRGDPDVPPRTQPSIAVSARGETWSVINASPDIRDQFAAAEEARYTTTPQATGNPATESPPPHA